MKYLKKIQELLDREIGDYSYESQIKLFSDEDEIEEYDVTITDKYCNHRFIGRIALRADDEKIEIELGEDNWEKIETFDWTIKYFWMALLTK